MTLTVLKVLFKKQKTRSSKYCKYKFYNNHIFRVQFLTKLNYLKVYKQDNGFTEFQEAYLIVLNSVPRPKCKFIRTNQTSFMTELLLAIMIRSKLRNKFLSNSLPRKTKKKYHSNLIVKIMVRKKNFCKNCNFFPDKSSSFEKMSFIEQDRVIIDNRAIAEVFNDYFSNYRCVKSVRIRSYSSLRIQPKCGKMRTRITPNTFHSVIVPVLGLKIPGT